MIYIVCALKEEAETLIRHYKLKRVQEEKRFRIYKNDKIGLVISGIGKIKSAAATAFLLKDSSSCDTAVNIGIAAAPKSMGSLGEPFAIKRIVDNTTGRSYYSDILFSHPFKESLLTTYDLPQFSAKESLADMEASGFFISALNFLKGGDIFAIKIISDHFEEKRFEKNEIVGMIEKKIEDIEHFIHLASVSQTDP